MGLRIDSEDNIDIFISRTLDIMHFTAILIPINNNTNKIDSFQITLRTQRPSDHAQPSEESLPHSSYQIH